MLILDGSALDEAQNDMTQAQQIKISFKPVDVQEVVEEFLSHCRVQGLSEDSIRRHGYTPTRISLRHYYRESTSVTTVL